MQPPVVFYFQSAISIPASIIYYINKKAGGGESIIWKNNKRTIVIKE
jgi:hypothetical protein